MAHIKVIALEEREMKIVFLIILVIIVMVDNIIKQIWALLLFSIINLLLDIFNFVSIQFAYNYSMKDFHITLQNISSAC